jgi:hypothetical protein
MGNIEFPTIAHSKVNASTDYRVDEFRDTLGVKASLKALRELIAERRWY